MLETSKEKEAEVDQAVSAVETIKEELDTFIPITELTLLDGRIIPLPKISWKKEAVIFQKVGELFASIEDTAIDFSVINPQQIMKIVTAMLRSAPDIITTIVSVITDLSEEEVEEQLDSAGIVQLLVPFFSERVQTIAAVINKSLTS